MAPGRDLGDLRRALVAGNRGLYLTNAHFRHAVDVLAQMLPAMVDGLAAAAVEQAAELHERYLEALAAPPLWRFPFLPGPPADGA